MKQSGFGIIGAKAVISSPVQHKTKKVETKPNPSKQATIANKPKPKPQKKQQTKNINKTKQLEETQKPTQHIVPLQQKISPPTAQQNHQDNPPIQSPQTQTPQPSPPTIRSIQINYSHYTSKFDAIDNILDFRTIDEKYCISFVFKGNFVPKLKSLRTQQYAEQNNQKFAVIDDIYLLQIEQDEEQEAKYENKGYVAPKQPAVCKGKKIIEELTEDLKGLSVEELKNKGEKYRQIIEQRDLEDILYR